MSSSVTEQITVMNLVYVYLENTEKRLLYQREFLAPAAEGKLLQLCPQ